MKRADVLENAAKCVCMDREKQYGSPENSLTEIARSWSWWLDFEISAHDASIMMALMKVARLKTGTFKDDSYVDGIGYLACAAEISDTAEIKER